MVSRYPKILLAALHVVAFWDVWRWYFQRVSTSADESFGFIAIIAVAAACLWFRGKDAPIANRWLIIGSILLYAVSYSFLPPLLRASIAMTSLAFAVSGWYFGRRLHFGIWSLFLLSLPLVPSLQFYAGFPLRVIVGEATVLLLKLNGLVVVREGIALNFGQQSIWIDAPCSGIKMMWTGFFLTSLLVTIYGFTMKKTIVAFVFGFAIVLAGNILRATGLFYLEAGLIRMPQQAHDGIGVVSFLITCIGIVYMLNRLRGKPNADFPTEKTLHPSWSFRKTETAVFAFVCLAAMIAPLSIAGVKDQLVQKTAIAFPTEFEGRPIQEIGLTEREKPFTADFPGDIRRFTDGYREIIIRYVSEPTRKLHTASDCLTAIGYSIKPLPLKIGENDERWACFRATRDDGKLKVCERIYTEKGENWTDVSTWYWSAFARDNTDGYWAVTVSEGE